MDKQIDYIVHHSREARKEWLAKCVCLLRASDKKRTLDEQPNLHGNELLVVCAYQCLDALELAAAKQYIAPENGKEFANRLFMRQVLLESQSTIQLAQREYQTLSSSRPGGLDAMRLSMAATLAIMHDKDALACMTLSTLALSFSTLNQIIVAWAFDDEVGAHELEKQLNKLVSEGR